MQAMSQSVLAAQVDAFLRHLTVERRAAARTAVTYGRDLQALQAFVAERKLPADARELRVHHLRGFLARMVEAGNGPATVARKLSALRAFFRFHLRVGTLAQNPAASLRMPKVRKPLPTFLTVDAAIEVVETPAAADALSLRDRAMLELLYGSGVRVGELVGLDLQDVDLARGEARVLGKGNKERVVPLGRVCVEALMTYLPARLSLHPRGRPLPEPEALFVSARGRRLTARRVQQLVSRYGADGSGRPDLHPHVLRHTCATHLLDAGADLRSIQELLGHSSLSTTQRYTHVSVDRLREVYERAHPLARTAASQVVSGSDDRNGVGGAGKGKT